MEKSIFQSMSRVEDRHWWFVARRHILNKLISGLKLPKNAAILEAGCGTGGNLKMLSAHGNLSALEYDAAARMLANARGVIEARPGALPDEIPFAGPFDLIALLDVLEHLEHDEASLAALAGKLAPGGRLLLTVPAFMFLWSRHDTSHHHHRRYTLPQLKKLLNRAGLRVTFSSYFNFWLFPLIAFVRLLERWKKPKPAREADGVLSVPPAPLNALLKGIFGSEAALLPRIRLPFGVSIVVVAEKN